MASCTTTASQSSHVANSPYAITCTQGTLTAYNYDFTNFVPGNLTVNPALLTITADNKVKTYGGPLPALTVSYSGLVNGDTPATFSGAPNTAPTIATTATTTSHVGTYGITASAAADADYTMSYAVGTLTVNPALLTITADNKVKTYGGPLPALTGSYSRLVNGGTPATFSGAPHTPPTITTTATPTRPRARERFTTKGPAP